MKPRHPTYINLSNLRMSLKLLFSGYLIVIAIGYFVALVQILFTHGMADGHFGLSIEDIVYSYYGNRSGTVIERKLKYPSIIMPYIFLLLDICSWWLTKLNAHFAWLVIIGGAGLAMAFAFMWIVSMYEMWLLPLRQCDIRNGLRDE